MIYSEYRATAAAFVAHHSRKAIYFFEMSVLFETDELNAYVCDSGFYRRKDVQGRRQGEKSDDHSRGPKASPVHIGMGITETHERTARRPPCRSIGLQ